MADPRKASEDRQEPAKVARQQPADAQETPTGSSAAPVFPVERLTGGDAYALTGYDGHVIAGALAGSDTQTLTIEEAQAAVKAWLEAPLQEA